MTSIRQLITDGFRESGVFAVGTSPDAEAHEEGLRQIRRLLRSLFGNELGEPLTSINFGSDGLVNPYATAEDQSGDIESRYIPINYRLLFNNTSAVTLYADPNPADGARMGIIDRAGAFATANVILNGNGRNIESASTVTLSTNGLNREWFYRADLGNWARVTDPDADDESPFPIEFDDLLTTLLAFRLNPRYGAETSINQGEVMNMMRKRFRARYRQEKEMPLEDAILFLPLTPRWALPEADFNRG